LRPRAGRTPTRKLTRPDIIARICRTLVAVLACACAAAAPAAASGQSLRFSAQLTPEHLGGSTTVDVGFQIQSGSGRVPPPLQLIDLRYPRNLGIALSGLGIETCTAPTLELLGPPGCPPDSLMGRGTVLGEIPFGPAIIRETATLTIVRAENQNGQIALLFDARGISPVEANLVFPGVLLPSRRPYGGDIRIAVPPVPSLPEAPDVAVVALQATLGPAGLTYYEQVQGVPIPYTPRGILLPESCPDTGFPFAATIAFVGGQRSSAATRVRCPRAASRRRHHRAARRA
jgi:hypothetical protein